MPKSTLRLKIWLIETKKSHSGYLSDPGTPTITRRDKSPIVVDVPVSMDDDAFDEDGEVTDFSSLEYLNTKSGWYLLW